MPPYFPPWLEELVTDATQLLGNWTSQEAGALKGRISAAWPPVEGESVVVARGLLLVSQVFVRDGDIEGFLETLLRVRELVVDSVGPDRNFVICMAGTRLAGAYEDLGEWDL